MAIGIAAEGGVSGKGRLGSLRWRGQRWVSPVALVALWELGAFTGLIPERVLAAPSAVTQTFWDLLVGGELISNVLVSLARAGAGLACGLVAGVTLALIAGLSRTGEAIVDPLMQIKRTLPVLALTPLFIVWFGIGETPKIALLATATVFPIYLNLFAGVRGVDARLVEAARSFGLSGFALIRHVILPGALAPFFVGLRYASGVAMLVLVIAEQINAQAGLGHLINQARDFLRTDIIVVCLVVYAMLGLTADLAIRMLERATLSWRGGFRP